MTRIEEIKGYLFETEYLLGEIRWTQPKPGIVYLCHKGGMDPRRAPGYDLLPEVPRQALLNPEHLKVRGIITRGDFRGDTMVPAQCRMECGAVVFHIPAEQMGTWKVDVNLKYSPRADWIDLEVRLTPQVRWENFDFLFASYIIEEMESTWVSAQMGGVEEWRKLDNRNGPPFGPLYAVPRDEEQRRNMFDGRYGFTQAGLETGGIEGFDYFRPILVAQGRQRLGLYHNGGAASVRHFVGTAALHRNSSRLHNECRFGPWNDVLRARTACCEKHRPISSGSSRPG